MFASLIAFAVTAQAAEKADVSVNPDKLTAGIVHSEGYFLPRGLSIPAELRTPIDTRINQTGDIVTVQTTADLFLGDYNVIPANSFLHGYISNIKRPGRAFKKAKAEVVFDRLSVASDGVNKSRNVQIHGKLSIKEFGAKSHNVNDATLYSSRAKKAAAIGGLVGGGTTATVFGLTHLYRGFGTSGMMVARAATLMSAGAGVIAGLAASKQDDKRLEPGTAVTITLDEQTMDNGEEHYYYNEYSLGAPIQSAKPSDAANKKEASSNELASIEINDAGEAYDKVGSKLKPLKL